MNTRQRFVNVLTGQAADRVPFMKVFGGSNSIVPAWTKEYPGLHQCIDQVLQFEGRGRGWFGTPVKLALCDVSDPEIVEDTAQRTVYRSKDGTVQIVFKEGGSFSRHTVEYPVKNRADWQRIKSQFMDPEDSRRFPPNWPDLVRQYRDRDYPLQLTHAGVYGFARRMLGDEALSFAFYDDPALVHDIMNTYTEMALAIWTKETAVVEFDLIECWEDMASRTGALISPALFREFLKPNYLKVSYFARRHHIPIILVDCDGLVEGLVPLWVESGVTAAYPFEVQSGNDVERVRRRFPDFGIIGALDKNVMARDHAAIDAEILKAARLIQLRRYVPGPDHFVLADASWSNYRYFMEQLRQTVMASSSKKD